MNCAPMLKLLLGAGGRGFVTKWTVGAGVSVTLPLVQSRAEGALSYNCTVNWGDNTPIQTITTYNSPNATHTYTSAGTYNVEIRGTCGGWSFNNAGSKLAIVAVVYWGDAGAFNGFAYLKSAFYGCTNLTSLGTGVILPSGTGILSDGFSYMCNGCSALSVIPTDLFKYNTAAQRFAYAFYGCTSLTTIPTDLFRYNTAITTSGFYATFQGCTSLTTIPTDLFRYNTSGTTQMFRSAFDGCSALSAIPTDLFRYNTAVDDNSFTMTFHNCTSLTTIPTDLFRYNTSADGFIQTFQGCTSLTTIPTDLFRYNLLATTFYAVFQGCSALTSAPGDLFRYNTLATGFTYAMNGCLKLQIVANLFFEPGEETTRFLNVVVDFTACFSRTSFSGVQGTAPDLWTCNFGETITLSTAPATDWSPGDTVTGQTSAATAIVVSKVSSLVYKIKQHIGTFTLGEIVGVTGVPAKLAVQDGTHPTFSGTPTSTTCFGGAGNSLTSLTNYASIPTGWH